MRLFSVKIVLGLLLLLVIFVAHGQEQNDEETLIEEDNSNQKETRPKYVKPVPKGAHHFVETFDHDVFDTKWIRSESKKDDVDEIVAKYDGKWSLESSIDASLDGDKGLVLKSKARHHAISAKLLKPFDFTHNKPLIIQYEVKFQTVMECGGAYVKLLTDSASLDLKNFNDKTPYTIMFGPDKCGGDSKNHFIIRYKHPKTGSVDEKHAKKTESMDPYFVDGKTHLYTLAVYPDGRFSMRVDQNEVNSGSLLTDLTPSIQPEAEIIDPEDKKPDEWDDREKIVDETASKPEDWDENEPRQVVDESAVKPEGWLDNEEEMIPDPVSVKPDDWDDDVDGEWEAPKIDNPICKQAPGCGKWSPPMIDNPKYKGKWRAPLVDNPNFKGKWEPRKIPNPYFFEDSTPFKSLQAFSAIGLELWSMTDQIYFDNFLITDDESVADEFAKDSFVLKKLFESKSSSGSGGDSLLDTLVNETKNKPWLWAVYILIILVPIVLIVIFCCGKSDKTQTTLDSKKTDEPTSDDNNKTAEEHTQANEQAQSKVELKKSKDDLEADDDEKDEEKEEEQQKEEEQEEQGKEEEVVETPVEKTSPRRRKNRKD